MKKVLLTGCAGFLGINVLRYLLNKKINVIGIDNLSTGKFRRLSLFKKNKKFNFYKRDLKNIDKIKHIFDSSIDLVIHLAANADVRFGLIHPSKDLEENTLVTFNILECMRKKKINKIAFTSTGSIYGESKTIPTPENVSFPIQTSLYGASKLACEGLIQAYSEGYDIQSYIFRLVSIMGPHYSHGHVVDFYKQLLNDPSKLHILGNGKQKKSYLHVFDFVGAVFKALNKSNSKINIFNLGVDDTCTVNDSAKWICKYLNLKPKFTYEGGNKGWIGDNPHIHLDVKKIKSIGWKNKYNIEKSVTDTIKFLEKNKWAL